ncbi:hypothetical protein BJX70DRAFT_371118 [Aspergillus crustosus]
MRPTKSSKPNLSLLYTSTNNTDYHSPPTSPLSSTSTNIGSSPTIPSSPTSPSLSPTIFQNIQTVSTKFPPSSSNSTHHNSHRNTTLPLRHRPSNIDTLLRQERSRATTDSIERQGLELLEPRPVDLDLDSDLDAVPVGIEARIFSTPTTMNWAGLDDRNWNRDRDRIRIRNRRSWDSGSSGIGGGTVRQPRFVMGGIFEVMEGRG